MLNDLSPFIAAAMNQFVVNYYCYYYRFKGKKVKILLLKGGLSNFFTGQKTNKDTELILEIVVCTVSANGVL